MLSLSVRVVDFTAQPVIAYPGNSAFGQVFNPSWVAGPKPGLLIRTQNCTFELGKCAGCSGAGPKASILTFSEQTGSDAAGSPVFAPVTADSVVFGPHDMTDDKGTEDPRVAYNPVDKLYYMYYTCFNSDTTPQDRVTMCLATSADPTSATGWTRHGPVGLPEGSKSGALLLRPATAADPDPEHVLLWGAGVIHFAKSRNLSQWPVGTPFITNTSWGNPHVESGPPPMLLSSGDWIFFHNSWSPNFPRDPPGYQPAWVVLSGDVPSKILARATEPLWSAQKASWMTGQPPSHCNVPNVAFLEAAHPVAGQPDTFRVFFGGADAVIGTAVVKVELGEGVVEARSRHTSSTL